MEGVPTTAGCRAVADLAQPATPTPPASPGAAAGARIVGRTNLHELALGVTGVNPWFGTPVNPLDPGRVPGGSSSGSAVAVATGEAEVAFGSDTGGSVRIPAACCGIAALKTTWGRVSVEGVWPLAPSFDTVGPMARDVRGLVTGMELLEPGFRVASTVPRRVAGSASNAIRSSMPRVDGRSTRPVGRSWTSNCRNGAMPQRPPSPCWFQKRGRATGNSSSGIPTRSARTCSSGSGSVVT